MYTQGSSYLLFAALLCACLCMVMSQEKKDKTLTCWACSSDTKDDPCVDGTKLNDTNNVETCSGPEAVCIKVFSHVYGIQNGDSDWDTYPPVVSRFCAKTHPLHGLGCASTEGIKGKQVTCLCDNEDRCNSSGRAAFSILSITLATLLAKLL